MSAWAVIQVAGGALGQVRSNVSSAIVELIWMIILLASLHAQSANLQMLVVKNVKVIFLTYKIVLFLQIFLIRLSVWMPKMFWSN